MAYKATVVGKTTFTAKSGVHYDTLRVNFSVANCEGLEVGSVLAPAGEVTLGDEIAVYFAKVQTEEGKTKYELRKSKYSPAGASASSDS